MTSTGGEKAAAKPGRTRGGATAPPRRIPEPPTRVLLATPALPIGDDVIQRVRDLAAPGATVIVLGVAKIYGTSLGLPHPGLQPNPREWEEVRSIVEGAAERLRALGFDIRVALTRTRNAPKMIAKWAEAKRMHAVVVPDPVRTTIRRMIEGDLEREIGHRTAAKVHPVAVPPLRELHRGPGTP